MVHESVHWVQYYNNEIAASNNIILFNEDICGKDTLGCLNTTWKANLTKPEIDIIMSTKDIMETQAYFIETMFIFIMLWIALKRIEKSEGYS